MIFKSVESVTMRGGALDEDANVLYQEATTLHNEELCQLASKMETLVMELVQAKNRQDSASLGQPPNLGKLKVSSARIASSYCCCFKQD